MSISSMSSGLKTCSVLLIILGSDLAIVDSFVFYAVFTLHYQLFNFFLLIRGSSILICIPESFLIPGFFRICP